MKRLIPSTYLISGALSLAVLTLSVLIYAQQKAPDPESCPMMAKMANASAKDCPMKKHDMASSATDHDQMVMKNGEAQMGFSQTATTHHFLLMKDGGAIRITANDSGDTADRDKIRAHLKEIAQQFKNGIFTTPFAIHGQVPPGVPEMDKLKAEIDYTFEEIDNGAQVRIRTGNTTALEAIFDFLKFQIVEHKTGDPTMLTEN